MMVEITAFFLILSSVWHRVTCERSGSTVLRPLGPAAFWQGAVCSPGLSLVLWDQVTVPFHLKMGH